MLQHVENAVLVGGRALESAGERLIGIRRGDGSANGALDMAQLLRESGARGGGKPDMAQGSAPDGAALESAKQILFNK